MAASGINEHYEACRKQNLINKRAYLARIFRDRYVSKTCNDSPQVLERKQTNGSSREQQDSLRAYHLENVHRRHEHDEMTTTLKKHCRPTYSAKLSHRFTSVNYSQQL